MFALIFALLGGVLPETEMDRSPISEVRWLWDADTPVAKDAVCYFRKEFVIPERVESATIKIHYDDYGDAWINGQPLDRAHVADQLVKGRNVLAIYLKNGVLSAGVLVRLDLAMIDGQEMSICSDCSFKSIGVAPKGWEKPDFDDSSWKFALDQGDVWQLPWAEKRRFDVDFATKSEIERRDRRERETFTAINESIGREPDPVCSIVYEGNVPMICVNGKNYPACLNLCALGTPEILSANIKHSKFGAFKFHELQFEGGAMEKAPSVYDFSTIDIMARRLLHFLPDDYLFLRFDLTFPRWSAANPDECIGYQVNGKSLGDEYGGTPIRASAASLAYRKEITHFFTELGKWLEQRPWMKRVVGVRVCWGVYTEWHTFGMHNGPDSGKRMTEAFHSWKGGKWKDAEIPTMAERRKPQLMLDPAADEKTLDYFECMNSCTRSLLHHMLRNVKRILPGRLAGAYWGYVFNAFPPEGQNCIMEGVLDWPELDFCSGPSSYTSFVREPGGTYHLRSIPAAYRKRGKLCLREDDMCFHHILKGNSSIFQLKDAAESRAVMCRNMLLNLMDGCGIQLCDPFDQRWRRLNVFDHEAVYAGEDDALRAMARAGRTAETSGNDVVVVASPRERLRWASPVEQLVSRHASAYLPHYVQASGIAADMITLEDFLTGEQKWKYVIFPDEVTLADDEIAALSKRLKGSKSVWYLREPPISGPDHVKASHIPEGARDMNAGAEEWSEMLVKMGAHLWSEPGKCLRKYGNLVMMSLPKAGEYHLYLPKGYRGATELVGGKSYEGRDVAFSTTGPETLLFQIH